MNTNTKYTYFFSYSFNSGTGMTTIATDRLVDSWESLAAISKQIGHNNGWPPVTITSFQLLSGPGSQANLNEALVNVHRRLCDAVDAARATFDDETRDPEIVAEVLYRHVQHTRAAIGALIGH